MIESAMRSTRVLTDHELELRLEPGWVHADPRRLHQMLTNLLTNAIRG
jgi:signal transduction histidine kinase